MMITAINTIVLICKSDYEQLINETNMSLDLGMDISLDLKRSSPLLRQELETYLDNLDYVTLRKLVALMLQGQDCLSSGIGSVDYIQSSDDYLNEIGCDTVGTKFDSAENCKQILVGRGRNLHKTYNAIIDKANDLSIDLNSYL